MVMAICRERPRWELASFTPCCASPDASPPRDVVPVKPFTRGLVMIEQLGGVPYIAMVVSRLVGLTVLSGRRTG
jgi:hypothetical protein